MGFFFLTFLAGRSCHSPLGEDRRDPGPPRKDRMTKFCGHNLFSLIVMQISFLFQNMNSLTAATLRGGLSASFWLQLSALKIHLLTSNCFRLLNARRGHQHLKQVGYLSRHTFFFYRIRENNNSCCSNQLVPQKHPHQEDGGLRRDGASGPAQKQPE